MIRIRTKRNPRNLCIYADDNLCGVGGHPSNLDAISCSFYSNGVYCPYWHVIRMNRKKMRRIQQSNYHSRKNSLIYKLYRYIRKIIR